MSPQPIFSIANSLALVSCTYTRTKMNTCIIMSKAELGTMSTTHEAKERHRSELRAEILQAARELLREEGYEGFTLRKLGQRMECSPMALHSYFADKQAIFTALAQEASELLAVRLDQSQAGDPLSTLRKVLRAYIAYAEENPLEYRLSFLESQRVKSQRSRKEMRNSNPAFSLLFRCVETCSEAGVFRGDVFAVTAILWTGVHGAAIVLLSEPNSPFVSRERFAEEIVETLLSGIRNVVTGTI
jgi:AcrR family transcriptional regulator